MSAGDLLFARVVDEAGLNNAVRHDYFHGPLVGPVAQSFVLTHPYLRFTNLWIRISGVTDKPPTVVATLHDASGIEIRRSNVGGISGNFGGGWYSILWDPVVRTVPGDTYSVRLLPIVDDPAVHVDIGATMRESYPEGALYQAEDFAPALGHDLRMRNLTPVSVARAFWTRISFADGGAYVFLVAMGAGILAVVVSWLVIGFAGAGRWPPLVGLLPLGVGTALFAFAIGARIFAGNAIHSQDVAAYPPASDFASANVLPVWFQFAWFAIAVSLWLLGSARLAMLGAKLTPETELVWLWRMAGINSLRGTRTAGRTLGRGRDRLSLARDELSPAVSSARANAIWLATDLVALFVIGFAGLMVTAGLLQVTGSQMASEQVGIVAFFFIVGAAAALFARSAATRPRSRDGEAESLGALSESEISPGAALKGSGAGRHPEGSI